jgi:hypothetical protein
MATSRFWLAWAAAGSTSSRTLFGRLVELGYGRPLQIT